MRFSLIALAARSIGRSSWLASVDGADVPDCLKDPVAPFMPVVPVWDSLVAKAGRDMEDIEPDCDGARPN